MLIYGVVLMYTILDGPTYYGLHSGTSGFIGGLILTLHIVIWTCQLVSFTFLISSTFKIRKLILNNSALSRQVDKRIVRDLLIITSGIFTISFLCYLIFIILMFDSNISLFRKLDYS